MTFLRRFLFEFWVQEGLRTPVVKVSWTMDVTCSGKYHNRYISGLSLKLGLVESHKGLMKVQSKTVSGLMVV